ncbi:MAG: hypothetical protein WCL20_01175 [Actinomycetes bacterium]
MMRPLRNFQQLAVAPRVTACCALIICLIVLLTASTDADASTARRPLLPVPSSTDVDRGVFANPGKSVPASRWDGHRRRLAHAARVIPSGAYGKLFDAGGGTMVRINMSSSYSTGPDDDAALQTWADLAGSMLHGSELSRLKVYMAPSDEVQSSRFCGRDALGCYFPSSEEMIVSDHGESGGPSPQAIFAHEYGHHIARNRSNYPWSASDWGPKRWATRLHICQGVRAGRFFPNDEGSNYDLNPSEGWSEAYRVANGYETSSWDIVANIFRPNKQSTAAIRADVSSPFRRATVAWRTVSFTPRLRQRELGFSFPLDGRVTVHAKGRGIDPDLSLLGITRVRRVIARSSRYGIRDALSNDACGYDSIRVRVRSKTARSGSVTLSVSRPVG